MELWLSGELQHDIGEAYRVAMNEIEDATNARIRAGDFGEVVKKLALIAVILEFEDPRWGEVRKFHKKRGVAEFRLKIPHPAFRDADAVGKRSLIVQMILRAIEEMPKVVKGPFDYRLLRRHVVEVAREKGWISEESGGAGHGASC